MLADVSTRFRCDWPFQDRSRREPIGLGPTNQA
jgi:hypothetical protein